MCDYCSWIEKILYPKIEDIQTTCKNILDEEKKEKTPKPPVKYDPTIVVHGTADSVSSREEIDVSLVEIENAAVKAYKELAKGCEAVEAVEFAIRRLETVEQNTHNLSVIKDAAIMDSERNAGSVGATTDSPHPISLAKKVLRETDHVLIVESGVRKLEEGKETGRSNNLSESNEADVSLQTPPNSKTSKEEIEAPKKNYFPERKGIRIYGSLARDRKGRLACGISTSDDREKSVARSSMTSSGTVVGCGIFSDAQSCCSISSEDRAIYLYAPARKIVERLRLDGKDGKESSDLLNEELAKFSEETGESRVGTAALRVTGKPEVTFTSRFFPWASCIDGIVTSGCIRGEVSKRDVGELDMPLDCRCE